MSASMTALASLVRAEVNASGRSQADLCRAIGITGKHLSKFLTGGAGMSLDLVDEVLDELGRELVLSTQPGAS